MAEKRIDVKVLQYIMGHAHIDVTMDVYNHVSEMSRIKSEITRPVLSGKLNASFSVRLKQALQSI